MKKKLLVFSVLAVCLSLNGSVVGASSWGTNNNTDSTTNSTGWGDSETSDNIDSDVVITPNPPDITVNETTGELSIYGTEKIYYAIDNNEWIEYSSPITLSDGIHQVLAYQVNSEGIESSTTENEVWITTEATINADDEEDYDNLEEDDDTDDNFIGDGNIDGNIDDNINDNINDDFDDDDFDDDINSTDDNVEDNTNNDNIIDDDIIDDNTNNDDINDDNNDFSSDDSNISDIITIGGNDFDNDDTDYDYSNNDYNDSYDTNKNNDDDNDEKLPQTGSVLDFDNLGILLCGAVGTLLAYGKKKL